MLESNAAKIWAPLQFPLKSVDAWAEHITESSSLFFPIQIRMEISILSSLNQDPDPVGKDIVKVSASTKSKALVLQMSVFSLKSKAPVPCLYLKSWGWKHSSLFKSSRFLGD